MNVGINDRLKYAQNHGQMWQQIVTYAKSWFVPDLCPDYTDNWFHESTQHRPVNVGRHGRQKCAQNHGQVWEKTATYMKPLFVLDLCPDHAKKDGL